MKILLFILLISLSSLSFAKCNNYTVKERGISRIVTVCNNSNDELNESIANSGAKNFETMRKGWIPNRSERNNLRIQELEIKRLEQQLNNN